MPPPVCNGNGRAASAADDIHDSATVALSGAMHGGRVFASTLEHEDEDQEDEERVPCCESNGGGKGGEMATLGVRVPSCDLEEDSSGDMSDGEDLECGLGPCAPRWMQVRTTPIPQLHPHPNYTHTPTTPTPQLPPHPTPNTPTTPYSC